MLWQGALLVIADTISFAISRKKRDQRLKGNLMTKVLSE